MNFKMHRGERKKRINALKPAQEPFDSTTE